MNKLGVYMDVARPRDKGWSYSQRGTASPSRDLIQCIFWFRYEKTESSS